MSTGPQGSLGVHGREMGASPGGGWVHPWVDTGDNRGIFSPAAATSPQECPGPPQPERVHQILPETTPFSPRKGQSWITPAPSQQELELTYCVSPRNGSGAAPWGR